MTFEEWFKTYARKNDPLDVLSHKIAAERAWNTAVNECLEINEVHRKYGKMKEEMEKLIS